MNSSLILFAQVVLTALSFWFATIVRSWAQEARQSWRDAEALSVKLRAERDRITVAERELDALRRELRKLSGKFYASQRERDDWIDADESHRSLVDQAIDAISAQVPVCQNWLLAKQEGPSSDAAKCECLYCNAQRADRARTRAALVPKGAQATASTAKLNAGKP